MNGLSIAVRGLDVHLPDPQRWIRPQRQILRDVSFEVPRGQVTALVGTNGAGKTTLLRTLSGAYAPSIGEIEVEGVPLGGPEDAPFQPDHWSADDLVIAQRRAEPHYDARLVGTLLRRARIEPSAQLRRLSAGQRTRLLLAVALGIRPTLLMLDEPFAHLDPLARTEVLDELRAYHAGAEDRTILLSTHDLGEIDRFVDHIVLLHKGRVVLEASALDLIEDHLMATAETAAPHTAELRGARRSGDRLEGLLRAEDAVGLPGLVDLRRPTLQEVLTCTLREVSR